MVCLFLGFRGNRGKIPQIVIFALVGNGFQIFRVTPVGDADAGDLSLLCHGYSLLLPHNGSIGKPIPCNPAAFLHKPHDAFCIGIGPRYLIQCLLYKFLSIHIHRSFRLSFCRSTKIM